MESTVGKVLNLIVDEDYEEAKTEEDSMNKLETEIKKYYKELYLAFENSRFKNWFKTQACHFTAMQGKYYRTQEIKLLLVGIATNGWGQLDIQNEESFASAAIDKMKNEPIGQNMKTYMNTSRFWNYSRGVLEKLTGQSIKTQDDMVANYIAWSNLHKIAPNHPKKSGNNNPSKKQQAVQKELSKKILRTELSLLAPTHILFVTEKKTDKEDEKSWWWWIEPFIKGKTEEERKKMNGFLDIKHICGDYIRGKGIYSNEHIQDVKVVIVIRPENCKKEKWISEVVAAFNSL